MQADAPRDLVTAVRAFAEDEVMPVADDLDEADTYPDELVGRMRDLGLFGITIPRSYGGLGHDLITYCRVVIELTRGWMSLAGILNSHIVTAWMIDAFGTPEQKSRLLPAMAAGELRAAISLTEPQAGSDLQAIATTARRDGDDFVIDGEKMWCTNGLRAGLIALLAKTDPQVRPPHHGMTVFLVEKQPGVHDQPGLHIPPLLEKLGYRGLEGTRLVWNGFRTPAASVLGGEAGVGVGFRQFMAGLEVGRINVAARGVGLASIALERAIDHARRRHAFGRPIADHQAIRLKLADLATRLAAARLLTLDAAACKDRGERADLQAGMAKLFATELAVDAALESMRIHGGIGYLKRLDIERYYRDAPLLAIGEGTNEIQRLIIARRLLEQDTGVVSERLPAI